ncbi:MAG: D-alanyl-D-alanine carboxypeptidase [Oscillospiraceae bacterium]|nr:D-alanyl-D-alanine carboxypeptidase [Oscillospiraceae bacterium]
MLTVFFLLFTFTLPCVAEPTVSAKAAVVICADSGEIVYSKNSDERMPMASTTKIMTSLIALENGADDKLLTVTDEMLRVEGTSMGLKGGDSVSLLSLVKGMLICSGNDAANATAYIIAGGIEPFAKLMNERAAQIGMNNTHFVTPSGLDADGHYSTAYDMALLGAEAIKNPVFLNICSSKNIKAYYGAPPYRRVLTNHNKLLSFSDEYIGVKTGFTKKSGRCLVSAIRRDGKTLIAVTLSAPDDWNDHEKLYEYCIPFVKTVSLTCNIESAKLNIVGGKENTVNVRLSESADYTFLENQISYTYKIYIKQFEYAPVFEGEVVGQVEFFSDDGKFLKSVDLVAEKDVLSLKE